MLKTPKLKVVAPGPVAGPEPPRPLGIHGGALWKAVMSDYAITDSGGVEMLTGAFPAARPRGKLAGTDRPRRRRSSGAKTGLKEHPGIAA